MDGPLNYSINIHPKKILDENFEVLMKLEFKIFKIWTLSEIFLLPRATTKDL